MEEKEGMAIPSREAQISIASSSSFPGFKFSPTDEELISYYLKKKMEGCEKSVKVISEVEICRHEPWDLPSKSVIKSQNEWFFFSSCGRKYPNGTQNRRATAQGYWKATGKERDVKSGNNMIGTKRTLVFHIGRAPKGERTEWIMHEYCMHRKSQNTPVVCRLRKNSVFRLSIASDSEVGQMGVPEGDMAVMSNQVTSNSSSSDLQSIEQLDSICQSKLKLSDEATQAESFIHDKESSMEDLYAEILKDEIIKLDGPTESAALLNALMAPTPVTGMAYQREPFEEHNLGGRQPDKPGIDSATTSELMKGYHKGYNSVGELGMTNQRETFEERSLGGRQPDNPSIDSATASELMTGYNKEYNSVKELEMTNQWENFEEHHLGGRQLDSPGIDSSPASELMKCYNKEYNSEKELGMAIQRDNFEEHNFGGRQPDNPAIDSATESELVKDYNQEHNSAKELGTIDRSLLWSPLHMRKTTFAKMTIRRWIVTVMVVALFLVLLHVLLMRNSLRWSR
ncbi:hypothetical protein SAY87_013685 [Trapa incisa]|uniref:NAC domain-containing protein n=1 Tax=Trapa incisa TaxID=236973 RepID=A0AAN7KDV1_9MYRT|nr:hypothetical protein SAY87_013685 [Trapa incisa]